jgi:aryl-alcohol dehydrogenase-like predicted oxidoreductase
MPQGPVPPDSRAADSKANVFMMGRSLMAHETLAKVQRLSALAREAGLSMTQLALAWCLRQSNVSSVIIGATKLDQIDENISAIGVKLTTETIEKAEAILTGEVSGVSK